VSGTVNKQNSRAWECENSHDVTEHERDSPTDSVWHAVMKSKVTGPFFTPELAVKCDTSLSMMGNTDLRHVAVGTVFAPPWCTASLLL